MSFKEDKAFLLLRTSAKSYIGVAGADTVYSRQIFKVINDIKESVAFSVVDSCTSSSRGGSRTAAASKMERFVIIVNSFQPLTIITKGSILDVAAVLDPPLTTTIASYLSMLYRWSYENFICIFYIK